MNIINIDINFTNGINKPTGIALITGDYASTKIVFNFDRQDGTKIFEMKNPSGEVRYAGEIINNEVVLTGVDDGHNFSVFNESGLYIYEVSLYNGDSKLTSVKGQLPVQQEQVVIGDEVVEPYLPVFDELLNKVSGALSDMNTALENVNTAITQTNNLNIDIDKENDETSITLTKKDGTTKTEVVTDGESLEFQWQGTSLGVKTSSQSTYQYVDLQGVQGETGPMGSPFTIKKTYSTEQAMINDYDNMQVGDYVMIDGNVELQENATLWVKEETPAPTTKWHYLADFSGATGIQGETGATPNIQIGTVTSGDTPSVTRTGTNENPVLNFVLQQGEQGIQGPTGQTGNGISNIEKTSETATEKDYRINFTDGTHFDYSVENGEVTQAQLDEVIAENDYLNNVINQLPRVNGTGSSIILNNTIEAKMSVKLSPSEMTQEDTPTPDNPQPIHSVTGDNSINIDSKDALQDIELLSGYINSNNEIISSTSWYHSDYIDITNYDLYIVDVFLGNNPKSILYDINKTPIQVINLNTSSSTTNLKNYINAKYLRISTTTGYYDKQHLIERTTYPLTLGTLELNKIGDYEDTFIKATNETGLESGKWYLKKNIGKWLFPTGQGGYNSGSNWLYVSLSNFTNIDKTANQPIICTHFQQHNLSNYPYTNANGINNIGSHMVIRNLNCSSYNDYQTFLTNNNVYLYQKVETPTYILLNDTLQTQLTNIYNNMVSKKGQTNISQVNDDLPMVISASALLDLSTLVS